MAIPSQIDRISDEEVDQSDRQSLAVSARQPAGVRRLQIPRQVRQDRFDLEEWPKGADGKQSPAVNGIAATRVRQIILATTLGAGGRISRARRRTFASANRLGLNAHSRRLM